MTTDELRRIAHETQALREPPFLKYQPLGKHQRWHGVGFTASSNPDPGFNFAAVLEPDAPPLAEIVAEANRFFPGRYGILVDADTGHPCEAELVAAGWTVFEDESALVLPAIGDLPPPPLELAVTQVRDAAGWDEQVRAGCAFFGVAPEFVMSVILPACLGDPDMAFLIGRVGGEPAAVGTLMRMGPTAVVAGIAVKPDLRRRGYGAAMVLAVLREGRARGCTSASLRAMADSQPLYESLGFVPVARHRTYVPPA